MGVFNRTAAAAAIGAVVLQSLAPAAPALAAPERDKTRQSYCHAAPGDPREGRDICIRLDRYAADVCDAIEIYATYYGLSPEYFARLLWQESGFNPNAVSPMNAQGIAQFIPSTARIRGLTNPFNPAEALAASARYLAELERRFGNLGMAAVAYNAGEGRAERMIRDGSGAPLETIGYVAIITGEPVEAWVAAARGEKPEPRVDFTLGGKRPENAAAERGAPRGFHAACVRLAESRTLRRFEGEAVAWKPWGVQVAAHFKAGVASRMFQRLRAQHAALIGSETPMVVRERNRSFGPRGRAAVRIGRDSRAEAQKLCLALRARGAACTVVRNR